MKFFFLLLTLGYSFSLAAQPQSIQKPQTAYILFQKAENYYLAGTTKKAVSLFAKAEKAYGNYYNAKVIANALHSLAYLQNNQKDKAYFTFYETGETLAKEKKLSPTATLCLNYAISRYHWAFKERTEAFSLLNTVKKTLARKPNLKLPLSLEIEINAYLGETKAYQNQYSEAILYYRKAIDALSKLNAKVRYQKKFIAYYFEIGLLQEKQKEIEAALLSYQSILANKKTLLAQSPENEIELNFRLGAIYFKKKQYDLAASYLEEALRGIIQSNLNLKNKANITAMLAIIYSDKKQYVRAIRLNSEALIQWQKSLPNGQLNQAFEARLIQGLIHRKIEAQKGGISWYNKLAPDNEKNWQSFLANRSIKPIEAILLPNKKLDFNLALIHYQKANQLLSKFPLQQQKIKKIELLMAKGALFFEANDYKRSKENYQTALDLMQPIYPKKHPLIAEASRRLGECHLEEKNYKIAILFIDQAINASMQEGSEIDPNSVPDVSKALFPFELLNAISSRGLAMSGLEKQKTTKGLHLILKNYEVAIQLLQQIQKTHRNEGAKYSLTAITHKFCQQAVITAHSIGKLSNNKGYLSDAFKYAELSKSAVLLETIRDLKAKKISAIPKDLIKKENQLKVDIAYLKSEIFYELKQGKNKDKRRLLDLELNSKNKKIAHIALLQKLEKQYPKYYDLKYNYQLKTIKNLQKKLKENEAFLEYVVADSFVYLLLVTQQSVRTRYRHLDYSFPNKIKKFRQAIKQLNVEKYFSLGLSIYQTILGDNLRKELQQKKLIIAADAELNYIPFGILPLSIPDIQGSDAYSEGRFLIQKNPISYTFSANLFLAGNAPSTPKKNSPNKQKLSAWTPSFKDMSKALQNKGIIDSIGELPGAMEETQYIASLFDGTTFLGTNASEFAFKANSKKFHIIHIATHGIMSDKNPLYSNLILNKGQGEDGILHTYELFNMQIEADMAVLSACNSGVGKLQKGEGVMSIARGFAYAGVPNIVMSTWQVSDFTTKIIMSEFYKNLKKGMSKDKAMQQSKIFFLNRYKDKSEILAPFYWGAFIVVGNTDKVPVLIGSETNYTYIFFLVGILMLLISLFFLWKRKK